MKANGPWWAWFWFRIFLLKAVHWKLSIPLFECGLKSFWYKTKALPFELWFLFERFNDYIVRMSVNENVWDGFGLPRTAFSRLIKYYMMIPKDFKTQVWITPLGTESGMAQDRPLSRENGYSLYRISGAILVSCIKWRPVDLWNKMDKPFLVVQEF